MSSNINNTFSTPGSGPAPTTTGPHRSDMLNRADPRVDSDRDNSRTMGGNQTTGTNVPEGTYGTHSSRLANTADPRIDSDRDHHAAAAGAGSIYGSAAGYGAHEGGLTGTRGYESGGYGTAEGTHGPHGSRVANAADPRVDSDRDHRAAHVGGHSTTTSDRVTGTTAGTTAGTLGGNTAHTGPAPTTAGPHKSDILNKLDPRVDSNLDGSKTVGGNKTYAQS